MYYLGIDVGTTGTKTLAVNENGKIIGKGYKGYALEMPQSGYVEQSADDWWDAVVSSVREVTRDIDSTEAAAICLSAQGASMLAVDGGFRPLCPVITWMDSRAAKEAEMLARTVGGDNIYRKTGWHVSPGCDAAKIMWLRDSAKAVFEAAASFVSTMEFVNYRLTGRNVIDPTNASIRQMMDLQTGQWDAEILDAVGVDAGKLPEILPAGELLSTLTESAAAELGLPRTVRVYNGAHDQYCAAIGSGAVNPGDVLLATGTAWVLFGVAEKLLYADIFSPGIYPMTGKHGAISSMSGVGSAFKWLAELTGCTYGEINRIAAQRRSDPELLVYPYHAGGSPKHSPDIKAAFHGMTVRHDRYDLALALMEGAAFEVRMLLDEFKGRGMNVTRMAMTGGAAKSRPWCEIIANVTECVISRSVETDAAALGASTIAAVGEGVFGRIGNASEKWSGEKEWIAPEMDRAEFYRQKFESYKINYGKIYK